MAVRKRGDSWYYDITMRGKRYRGVIPEARTKQQAKRVERKICDEIWEGKYGESQCKVKFSEFANGDYKDWISANKRSAQSDFSFLKTLVSFFGNMTLGNIKQIHVERFKQERMKAPVYGDRIRKPASVNRELACLSRLFSIARENGLVKEAPRVRLLREDNQRTRWLADDEEKKLMTALEASPTNLRLLVILALHTGMRLGEMTSLTWQQVDFTHGRINVTNTKTGRDRAVPLNDETFRMLYDLRQSSPIGDRVFDKLPRVSAAFAYQCKKAGIENFHFHDLRHTFATRIADEGTNPFIMKELLGHSTIQMTARYTHATDERMRQAVESLTNRKALRHKSVTSVADDMKAQTA